MYSAYFIMSSKASKVNLAMKGLPLNFKHVTAGPKIEIKLLFTENNYSETCSKHNSHLISYILQNACKNILIQMKRQYL